MPFLKGGGSGGGIAAGTGAIVNADVNAAAAIATSKLANVTLAASRVTLVSGNITTTSTSLVDATGLTTTITTHGGNVQIGARFTLSNSAAGNSSFATILRGATDLGGGARGLAEVFSAINNQRLTANTVFEDLAPAAAATTYKIQWAADATTGTLYADGTNRIAEIWTQEIPLKGAIS